MTVTVPAPKVQDTLFTPFQLGAVGRLQHRIVMAPLSRMRADANHVVQDITAEYYAQRASIPGTLVIAEATLIAPQAGGYPHVPGVWSDDQIAGWKKVVDAVHAKGSFIILQLWALGRAAIPGVLTAEGNFPFVSASDIPLPDEGEKFVDEGPASAPRPLTEDEINEYTQLYVTAARNFVYKAGGDGVELHGANGYLIDQFFSTRTNVRTDRYGGSAANRSRFALEVVDAVVAAVGANRTALRMSPYSDFQAVKMPLADIIETFTFVTNALKESHPDLLYLHFVEPRIDGNYEVEVKEGESYDSLNDIWAPRPLLLAGGFDGELAREQAARWPNTLIVFGRQFIANPDLPARLKHGIPLNKYDRKTFSGPAVYGPEHFEGYTTYDFSGELVQGKL